MSEGYFCKQCGMSVIVFEGKILRVCGHEEATVIVGMSAVATGESTLEHGLQ